MKIASEPSSEHEPLTIENFVQLYKEEIEQHYSIAPKKDVQNPNLQNNLQNCPQSNVNKTLFVMIASPLVYYKLFVQDSMLQHYFNDSNFKKYEKIQNPKKFVKLFINEFVDELIFKGLKNIKNSIEKNTNTTFSTDSPINYNQIFENNFNFFTGHYTKVDTHQDHRRFSNCMLIRQKSNSLNRTPKDNSADELIQKQIINGNLVSLSSDFTSIQQIQEELKVSNTINLTNIFLGDIVHHRYLQDAKYIQNHIYKSQCDKYKPTLGCIQESEEENNPELISTQEDATIQQQQFSDSEDEYQDYDYYQELKSIRVYIQEILKKIVQQFESLKFQQKLKEMLTNTLNSVQQTTKSKNQKNISETLLNEILAKFYEFESVQYPQDILNFSKSQLPKYNISVDFSTLQQKQQKPLEDQETDVSEDDIHAYMASNNSQGWMFM